MNILFCIGLTVIILLMAIYEWPKMEKQQKKERKAFIILSGLGWLLGVYLIYFPHSNGPTQWVGKLYQPLTALLQ
ncbi:MAG TPA: hypothetical protein VFK33_16055 [Bacillales bacterium]|nr:hypothetical protein [Bacillales bacterium]